MNTYREDDRLAKYSASYHHVCNLIPCRLSTALLLPNQGRGLYAIDRNAGLGISDDVSTSATYFEETGRCSRISHEPA